MDLRAPVATLWFGGSLGRDTLNRLLKQLARTDRVPAFGVPRGPRGDCPEGEATHEERLAWWNDEFREAELERRPMCIVLCDPDQALDFPSALWLADCLSDLYTILSEVRAEHAWIEPHGYSYEDGGYWAANVHRGYSDGRYVDVSLNSECQPIIHIEEGDWFAPAYLAKRMRDCLDACKDFTLPLRMPTGFMADGLELEGLEGTNEHEEEELEG